MHKIITYILTGILSLLVIALVTVLIITNVNKKDLCTVSFYAGDELIFDTKVEKNKNVSKPKNPIIEGKTFEAWYSNKELTVEFDFNNKINSDISLYAKFNIKTFNISFNTNGGGNIESIKVEYNSKFNLPTPSKNGYIFDGWYKEETFVNRFTNDNIVDNDLVLFAKWKVNTYTYSTISFNSNGGSPVDEMLVLNDSTISIPLSVKESNILEGWYLDSSFNTPFDSKTIIDKDITLYAKWKDANSVESFSVKFDPDNGSGIINELVEKDHYALMAEEPLKEGYIFVNWVDENNIPFNFNTRINKDINLKAHYDSLSDDNYVVSFEANGGSKVSSIIVKANSTINPPLSVKESFILEGWYLDKEYNNLFDSNIKITSNIVLYAKWKKIDGYNTYKVEFDLDNGRDTIEAIVEKGKKVIKPETPVKEGYIFVNWIKENGNIFNFNTLIDENYKLKANYKENSDYAKFIIKFDTLGGSTIENIIVEAGEKIQLPVDPYLEGYRFIGWYLDLAYQNQFDSESLISSDMTLYARWEKYEGIKYTVYFLDYNNNILPIEVADDVFIYYQEVLKGDSAKAPMKPVRDGYRFDRWDKDFSNVTTDLEIHPVYVRAYQVDFYDYNRTLLKSEIVDYGMSATPPEDPTRVGYKFYGWDRDYDIIISDTVVRAIYEEQYHIVFKDYDGKILSDLWYDYGSIIAEPKIPTYDDSLDIMFDKWDKEFDFATTNMIITALVRVKSYKVSFVDYDGTILKEVIVKEGLDAEAPNLVEKVYIDWDKEIKEAYQFLKWDKDFKNVKEDLIVHAIYEKINEPVLYIETVERESGIEEVELKIYLIARVEFGALDYSFTYSNSLNTKNEDIVAKNQFANSSNSILTLDKEEHTCRFIWYSSRPITLSSGYSEVMSIKFTMDKHLSKEYYAVVFLDGIKLTKDGTEYIIPVVVSGGVIIK